MGLKTAIPWTTSTFNPWIGCTKVSVSTPEGDISHGGACDNCYAEELDRVRFSKTLGGGTKLVPISHWGLGAPRYRTSASAWSDVHKWNKAREEACGQWALLKGPKPEPHRVFCASLADVFDNQVPEGWRRDLWDLIRATPYLSWLLVTKRVGNVERMVPGAWRDVFSPHVRLLISVSNQYEADRDIPKLLALPCKNGISYEPALGPVDWSKIKAPADGSLQLCAGGKPRRRVEWIIVGGESTQGAGKARPFDLAWARSTVAQCKAAGVPVFVKQIGSYPVTGPSNSPYVISGRYFEDRTTTRAGADPAEWPEDLRVQCFPE